MEADHLAVVPLEEMEIIALHIKKKEADLREEMEADHLAVVSLEEMEKELQKKREIKLNIIFFGSHPEFINFF